MFRKFGGTCFASIWMIDHHGGHKIGKMVVDILNQFSRVTTVAIKIGLMVVRTLNQSSILTPETANASEMVVYIPNHSY